MKTLEHASKTHNNKVLRFVEWASDKRFGKHKLMERRGAPGVG